MTSLATRANRILAVVVLLAAVFALAPPASATKSCDPDEYWHRHLHGSIHFFNQHEVYQTSGSGTGEWTYWWDSEWDYNHWDYYHQYYGSLYCA